LAHHCGGECRMEELTPSSCTHCDYNQREEAGRGGRGGETGGEQQRRRGRKEGSPPS
jgi:hypothetical protein